MLTAQYPDDPESFAEALDQLLDDPDFLDAVADELLYQVGSECSIWWAECAVFELAQNVRTGYDENYNQQMPGCVMCSIQVKLDLNACSTVPIACVGIHLLSNNTPSTCATVMKQYVLANFKARSKLQPPF